MNDGINCQGRLYLDEANSKAFRAKVEEIEQHFAAFLKTKGKHYGFCRRERERSLPRTLTQIDRDWDRLKESTNAAASVYSWKANTASHEAPAGRREQGTRPARVGSGNGMGYMAGAVIFGLLGIIFWPLLILAAICLFLFFFVGVFNFDPVEDGKKVEGFGVLNGLPVGCAIPLVILASILFAVVMAGKK